jgi:TRAP-type C4-dicarboxylate transport system permease small subunit
MSMLVLVFGGMALCDRIGGHIAVDVFERKFSDPLKRATDIAAALIGAAVFAGIAWNTWKSAAMSAMLNQSTNIINLPFAWFKYFIVVASAVTVFGMLVRALSLVLGGALAPHEEHVE